MDAGDHRDRHRGRGLIPMWVVHALGVLAAVGNTALFIAYNQVILISVTHHRASPPTLTQWLDQVRANAGSFLDQFTGPWDQALATAGALASAAGAIELTFLVAGWMVMSWGARPEPVARSFGRSLRRLWGVTPALAALWCLPMAAVVLGDRAAASAGYLSPFYFAAPSDPWWIRQLQVLPGLAVFAAGYGAVAVVLWSVGRKANRWAARCRWPPLCEGCGYPLAGLETRPKCPECGRAVRDSIGPGARPGVSLRPGAAAGAGGWIPLAWGALRRPTALGRSVRVYAPGRGHRGFFIAVLAAAVVMCLVAAPCYVWGWEAGPTGEDRVFAVLGLGASLGLIAVVLMVVLVLGAAGGYGRTMGRRHGGRRDLLAGALQGACYMSPLLLGWVLMDLLYLGAAFTWQQDFLLAMRRAGWEMYGQMFTTFFPLVLNLAALAVWALVLGRAVRAMRYANR